MWYFVFVDEHCGLPVLRELCRTLGDAVTSCSNQVVPGMVGDPLVLLCYEHSHRKSTVPTTYALTPIEDKIEVCSVLTIGTGAGSCTPYLSSPSITGDHIHFILGKIPINVA